MLALTDSALAPLCHLRHGPRPDRQAVVELVRAGLAMATVERMVAGGKSIEVARVKITEAGRRALAEPGLISRQKHACSTARAWCRSASARPAPAVKRRLRSIWSK